jgi:hypothetical protein
MIRGELRYRALRPPCGLLDCALQPRKLSYLRVNIRVDLRVDIRVNIRVDLRVDLRVDIRVDAAPTRESADGRRVSNPAAQEAGPRR